MSQMLLVAWYRYRATFARQLTGYLTVVLLIGLIGGVAMASVAAGRRTQSSYPTFLASTNPSDFTMAVYTAGSNGGPAAPLKAAIARLPGVRSVVTAEAPTMVPLAANGAPRLSSLANVLTIASVDGMLVKQDRLAAIQGRVANPRRPNEIVMDTAAAQILGYRVGQSVPLGLYTHAEMSQAGFGTPSVAPLVTVHARLVGIVALNTEVVQDDVDRKYGFIYLTKALLHELAKASPGHLTPALYGVQLKSSDVIITNVEKELVGLVPRGDIYEFHVTSNVTSQVELAIKPESVALGAFGAIAALACIVLTAQAMSRILRRGEEDRRVVRALGASPLTIMIEGLVGSLIAIVLGTLVAVVVAIGLSPIGPLGPVRPVYPSAGFAVDWMVAGVGVVVLVGCLGLIAVALTYRGATPRSRAASLSASRRSSVARAAQATGAPIAGVVGMHFAFESRQNSNAAPVRSVLGGTILAVAMVVATLTFASGFTTLISRPPLYGWNWNYLLNPTNDVPPKALSLLSHDPNVVAWSGADYTDVQIDGQEVPILLQSPRAKVSPPILSGHGLQTRRQIVLGAGTLARLHKRVGDSVVVTLGTKKDAPYYLAPTSLTIVGTATMPAVGYSSFVAEHTSMGTGALLPLNFSSVHFSGTNADPNLNGPELVFIRTRTDVSAAAGRADLQRIANVANKVFAADKNGVGNGVAVLGVLRPVQVVNYRSIGSTPIFLAVGLAFGAILALGLTLASSVRRRRRDLALLKTLGFTHRQLAFAVASQATTTAVIGVGVGVPLGIVIGRELWTLFARSINAVPDPTIPTLSLVIVGVGALVFANLVAVLPGRWAARTPAALALRAE